MKVILQNHTARWVLNGFLLFHGILPNTAESKAGGVVHLTFLTEVTRHHLNHVIKGNFTSSKTCQCHETPEKGTRCYGVVVGTLSSGHDMAVAISNQSACGDPQETLTRLRPLRFPHRNKVIRPSSEIPATTLSVPPWALANPAAAG